MRQISFFMLLCSFLFVACNSSEPAKTEKTEKTETVDNPNAEKAQEKKQELTVQEIGDKSLILGEWKIAEMDGKPVPEDRKEITATFEKDGNFKRKLSPKHDPEIGTWSIEDQEGKKILRLNTPSAREINQLIKLTANELIFMNYGKSVKLIK
jgi:hypothetical protein